MVAAGEESKDAPAPAPPAPVEVERLLAGLKVERTGKGGLRIEAPPESASTLAALFSGLAQMLQSAAKR
jgi:hypothetical protein